MWACVISTGSGKGEWGRGWLGPSPGVAVVPLLPGTATADTGSNRNLRSPSAVR